MFQKYFSSIILFLFSFASFAQDLSSESLQKMEYEELLKLLNENRRDSIKAEKIANYYLIKAKKEKDTLRIAKGYDRLARVFNYSKNLKYTDSLILLTQNINNYNYPGLGYLLKAQIYNDQGDLKKATENYFKAYEYSVKSDNIPYQLFTLGRLIFLKSIWGDKREALRLQKKRHHIIIKENSNNISKDELTSIFNFSFCYLNLRKLDSAAIYANKGLTKISNYKGTDRETIIDFFEEILVEINYYDKNYSKAIQKSDALLLKLDYKKSIENVQNLYYFKGLSLIKSNKYNQGISYLIKSDSIFEAENYHIKQPYQRKLFEELLHYYKVENKPRQQIKYLNKLIVADSIIIKNYQFFEPNLIKKIETPKLIKEKEKLIASLTKKNKSKSTAMLWGLGLLVICLLAIAYYFNRQQVYKKRFNKLFLENEKIDKDSAEETSKHELSKEIINGILDSLSSFEGEKEYLNQDISIQTLAKSFGTNYKYLSTVINLQKGKRFSNYINDLRVIYAYRELKEKTKFRKYTIKAIANECGFKNSESFSKAFYKNYGIYPSFYVKQLEKTINTN